MDVSDIVYFCVFCFVFFLGACSVFICVSAIIGDLRDRVSKWRRLNNPTEMGADAVPILPSESTDSTTSILSISEEAVSSITTDSLLDSDQQ